MQIKKLLAVFLKLFDGEGGGEGAGEAASAAQGETNQTFGTTRRRSGALSNVKYGKEAQAAVEQQQEVNQRPVTSSTQAEREAAYKEIRNGEYKDMFDQEFQGILNRRFKETKGLQAQVDSYKPILDVLGTKYGISSDNPQDLMKAIENDDAYWLDAADEAGMTVEQYKEFQRLQRENKELMDRQKQTQGQEKANAQLQQWYSEAEALKQKYNGFDLNSEVKNEQFMRLLKSGVPMEHAYQVIHFDELMNNAQNTASVATERAVVANIKARGKRPTENGTANQSAFISKTDVKKLTRADRAEIARRVARGEPIEF